MVANMKNIKILSLQIILTFVLLSLVAVPRANAQIIGGSAPVDKYIYGNIYDKASNKPLFGALLTLYGSGGQSSSQKSNSAGGFSFIKAPGTYSLYGSILGYQSNMCHFTVTTRPIKVTFVLAKLGTGPSSCDYTEQTESPTIVPVVSPATGDGTEGPSADGTTTDNSGNSVPTTTSSTVTAGGQIVTRSNCVVTKIGNPTGAANLPTECTLSTNPGGSAPTSCGKAPSVNYSAQQYADEMRAKWGIEFVGMTVAMMKEFWQEFHEVSCTGFLQDIRGTRIVGWDEAYSQQFSCPQDGGDNVKFSRYWYDRNGGAHPREGEYLQSFLTHELTHVWQFCSVSKRGQNNLLMIPAAYDGEGGISNYSRTGCNYASGRESLLQEDHADTIALYLNPTLGELTCGNGAGNPFAGGAHPLHRNVAHQGTGR